VYVCMYVSSKYIPEQMCAELGAAMHETTRVRGDRIVAAL